jgi:hypothetical protein
MYSCGTVIAPKYPRNLAPRNALNIPAPLVTATNRCEERRNERSSRALTYLAVGVVLLVGAMVTPAVLRALRRRRHRARKAYRV